MVRSFHPFKKDPPSDWLDEILTEGVTYLPRSDDAARDRILLLRNGKVIRADGRPISVMLVNGKVRKVMALRPGDMIIAPLAKNE